MHVDELEESETDEASQLDVDSALVADESIDEVTPFDVFDAERMLALDGGDDEHQRAVDDDDDQSPQPSPPPADEPSHQRYAAPRRLSSAARSVGTAAVKHTASSSARATDAHTSPSDDKALPPLLTDTPVMRPTRSGRRRRPAIGNDYIHFPLVAGSSFTVAATVRYFI